MSLKDLLAARIRQSGPISVADYMADCLMHPEHGYYATRDPLGVAGDFTTAPEISQMFGELIGLALAQTWLDQDRPAPFSLAELGPGRGTLMADALRAAARVPGFAEAARLVLVEASPVLRAAQATALEPHNPVWANSLGNLPDRPLFLIANEFFDALPLRQFERGDTGWRERRIGLDGDSLIFGLGGETEVPALALAAAEPGCAYTRLTPQGVFLERLGITQRAQALAAAHGGSSQAEVAAAHRRLTHPAEMGNLFKVFGLFPQGAAPPPGLNT